MLTSSFFARPSRRLFATVALLFFASAGCTSRAYVAAEAPVAIETYPRAYYDGRVVYWVGDRWYYQRGGGWVYYRSEPAWLYRHRHGWHGAYGPPPPRARPYYPHYHPPRHYQPPRHAAPPARRAAPPPRRPASPTHRQGPRGGRRP